MTLSDIDLLRRRLDTLTRAATHLRAHLPELHHLAWERPVTDRVQVQESKTDFTPKAGDPRARRLLDRIAIEVGRCEDILVGLDRAMSAQFFARSTNPEPSRGSLISAREHTDLIANQKTRPDTPARLVDQPTHPGAHR
jgi:hypothetical protein